RNSVLTQISTKRHQMMNPRTTGLAAATAFLVALAPAAAQTPTIGTYLSAAKSAAGTDWAGTFLRLCIPAPAPPAATAPRAIPARDTWHAEPARVADNLYFLGTKIHSAWAIVGSEVIIIIEALYDYAARDEILDGMKKLGLDQT